jgi:hypothetical protein
MSVPLGSAIKPLDPRERMLMREAGWGKDEL